MSAAATGKIDKMEQSAQRMREMIRRLDVDVLELAYAKLGGIYAEARDACLACENTSDCAHWLSALQDAPERPTFCPNLERFERFVRQSAAGGLSPEAALAFLVGAETVLPPTLSGHTEALAALDAALDLREAGRRGVKITIVKSGETLSSAEFARTIGASGNPASSRQDD